MKTRQKMYVTNSKIRKYLTELGFHHFYFFPHLRFQKDYTFEGCSFDAFAWKDSKICFIQLKTNKTCPKSELKKYKLIEDKYDCIACWVANFDRKNKTRKGIVIWSNKYTPNMKVN